MIIEEDEFGLNEIQNDIINIKYLNKKKILKSDFNIGNNNNIKNKYITKKLLNNNYYIGYIKKNDIINASNQCFKTTIK